jgi:hypothetical protein
VRRALGAQGLVFGVRDRRTDQPPRL